MPDCRSYELVSPPYKEGLQVESEVYSETEVVGEAPAVIARSIGAFSGGPDTPSDWSDYDFLRTGAGWATDPVDPSPSQYIAGVVNGNHAAMAVAGSGVALMQLRRPSESAFTTTLYRVNPGATPVLIGPLLPPSTIPPESGSSPTSAPTFLKSAPFAGASEDLSHVLYYVDPTVPALPNILWPGDTTLNGQWLETFNESLYEYVGVGHSGAGGDVPALVGVDGAGALISQCGISLGGPPEGSADRAISQDGERVVFTPKPGGCSGEYPLS